MYIFLKETICWEWPVNDSQLPVNLRRLSTVPLMPPPQICSLYPRTHTVTLQAFCELSPKWAVPMTTTYLYLLLVHMVLHHIPTGRVSLGLDASVLWRSV